MRTAFLRTGLSVAFLASASFAQSFNWSESVDNVTIIPGTGISCNATINNQQVTADNGYWRRYNAQARGLNANFQIDSVTFGIEDATAGQGGASQPATLRIWRDSSPGNPAPKASLVLLGSQAFQIPNTQNQLFTLALTPPIAVNGIGGDDVVIDLEIPDATTGTPAIGHRFFFGGNSAGQTSPTYLNSLGCGVPEPTDLGIIGFPNSHMIFDLSGTQTSVAPVAYCTAKSNSLGCLPSVSGLGAASASAPSGFTVSSIDNRNQKSGLLFYGSTGRANAPFQGGTLCVKAPIKRTPALNSGGTALPQNDCTGVYSIDMNAFARGALGGAPAPFLSVPGTMVNCQFWGRDPGFPAPNNTSLSDGLEYVLAP